MAAPRPSAMTSATRVKRPVPISAAGASWVTRTTLTSEITAPAERSRPARKDDDGLAERGERERRGARADAADVEIGDALAGDELQREHGGGEHGDGDDRAALT